MKSRRSPSGWRRAALPLTLFAAILTFGCGLAGAGIRSPLQGSGDFPFLADIPTFPEAGGSARADLTVRVDHDQVQPGGPDGPWRARVAVQWKLAREGLVAVDTLQVFDVRGDSTRPDGIVGFDLLEIAATVPPGRWATTVEVRVLTTGTVARASGVLEVRDPGAGPRLSDPEFRVQTSMGSLPHPERLYGVLQDTLEVYFEVAGTQDESVGVDVEVVDAVYGGMDSQTISLDAAPGPRRAGLYRLPLGTFPAGVYVLRMRPIAAGEDAAEVEAEFVVSWRLDRTTQDAADVVMEGKLVLPSDEIGGFLKLPRAVQAERLRAFWDEHDPTPGTPTNEIYEEFQRRVEFARRSYGEARKPGPLTDRGRIFVRYGEPSEVQVTVIPADGADLEEAIERVHDTFAAPFEGVIGRQDAARKPELLNPDTVGGIRPTRSDGPDAPDMLADKYRNRSRTGREGSFELWAYEGDGDPLFPDQVGWGQSISLRFLFVDRTGTGQYELDFTNLLNREE